jgi:hypothetical protein
MKGRTILFFLGFCLMLSACKKEIGKKEYTMTFRFESGGEISLTGKIYEKNKKNKKYQGQIDGGVPMVEIEKVGLYMEFYSYKANNTTITTGAIKSADKKLIVNSAKWKFWNEFPPISPNNQSGQFIGTMYLEGSYTQKGRAYIVEDGDFEFYWQNAEDFGMNDTILKGKWTLKRS